MDRLEEIKKAKVYDTPFGKLAIIKDELKESVISEIERLKEDLRSTVGGRSAAGLALAGQNIELIKENKQLKKEVDEWKKANGKLSDECVGMDKEIERLRKEKDYLLTLTAKRVTGCMVGLDEAKVFVENNMQQALKEGG